MPYFMFICILFCNFFVCVSPIYAAGQPRIIYCSVNYNPVAQPESAQVLAVVQFKKSLERLSGGAFRVRIAWNNALTPNYSVAQQALRGDKVHFTQMPASTLAAYSRALIPLSTLFLFSYPDMDLPHAVVDGPVGARIRERTMDETGLRILAFWELGYRHLTSVTKPLETHEDMRGEKWRVQPNPVHEDAFRRMGVEPVRIAWPDLYEALRRNAVSGSENTVADIDEGRLYEMQKNLLLTGHAFEFLCVVASERFYNSLSPAEKSHWDRAVAEATQVYRKAFMQGSAAQEIKLRKLMHVNIMTPHQQKLFLRQVEPSRVLAAQLSGPEYYAEIMAEIDKLRLPAATR